MRRRMWLVAAVGVAAAAGCVEMGAPEVPEAAAEVATVESALMGPVKLDSSCAASTTTLNQAARYGRVAAASTAFAECVDTTVRSEFLGMGPYMPCWASGSTPATAAPATGSSCRSLP